MKIGQLRHRVTIQKKNGGTNDGGGNITPNWENVATVWAKVEPAAFEKVQAGQSVQQITHTVTIRYRADLTATCRLVFNGRILDIKYITNTNERNREMVISCLEG